MTRTSHSLYVLWAGIKARCYTTSHEHYNKYGAKGIVMCDSWRTDFWNFLSDMGERPTLSHSIDRLDNSLGYSKSNCRWATKSEQCNNTCRNVHITYNNKTQTLSQWSKETGIYRKTLSHRINVLKLPLDEAFNPINRRTKSNLLPL